MYVEHFANGGLAISRRTVKIFKKVKRCVRWKQIRYMEKLMTLEFKT